MHRCPPLISPRLWPLTPTPHPTHRSQMNYQYKHLVGAMIVAGWDAAGGPQVYGCPIGGTLSKESWTTDGSGSTYIWGYLDEEFRCVVRPGRGRDAIPRPGDC